MSTIIDDLEKDHMRFRRYLAAYQAEVDKLANGRESDFRLLEFLAKYFSQFPDELHHKKEDIIYSRLEAKAQGERITLENLHAQHEELSRQARHFADIMTNILNDQELPIEQVVAEAQKYAATLTAHMCGEEETLFKQARRFFKTEDWTRVNDQFADLYAVDINFEKARHIRDIERLLDSYLE